MTPQMRAFHAGSARRYHPEGLSNGRKVSSGLDVPYCYSLSGRPADFHYRSRDVRKQILRHKHASRSQSLFLRNERARGGRACLSQRCSASISRRSRSTGLVESSVESRPFYRGAPRRRGARWVRLREKIRHLLLQAVSQPIRSADILRNQTPLVLARVLRLEAFS